MADPSDTRPTAADVLATWHEEIHDWDDEDGVCRAPASWRAPNLFAMLRAAARVEGDGALVILGDGTMKRQDLRPVKLTDPETGKERAFTAREAAALIVVFQALEAEDKPIDPATTYPEVVSPDTALGMAGDGECFLEHVEAHVLPYNYEPHAFTPDPDDPSECEICRDPPHPFQAPSWDGAS